MKYYMRKQGRGVIDSSTDINYHLSISKEMFHYKILHEMLAGMLLFCAVG